MKRKLSSGKISPFENLTIFKTFYCYRSILDSYIYAPDQDDEESQKFKKSLLENGNKDEEIISLDSDDDDDEDNIPLKSEDVTLWYSAFLKNLERQYPTAFDEVVKDVMSRTPGRKRNGLKNVLGKLFVISTSTR